MRTSLWITAIFSLLATSPVVAQPDSRPGSPFLNGVDANFSLALSKQGFRWKADGRDHDLFQALREAGIDSFRVRVRTSDGGPSGRDYAAAIAKKAQDAGLHPYPVLFLSENWADYVKQPAPATWQHIPLEQKLAAITAYCENTARYFRRQGVQGDLWEIGNEIDFGICGEFEDDWAKRFNIPYMKRDVWSRAAQVIRAAENGVRRVDPHAAFILHLTQWWNPDFCIQFLETMLDDGAQVDYLGLSFYPSSGLSKGLSFADLGDSVAKIVHETGRPIILCEYAYPSLPTFKGQFATWNHEVPGYPLSEAGQKAWIAGLLTFCRHQPSIRGAFYWSPEWYPEEMWKAFALFRDDGTAKAGLAGFRDVHGTTQGAIKEESPE